LLDLRHVFPRKKAALRLVCGWLSLC
jgi:hypothetical protein